MVTRAGVRSSPGAAQSALQTSPVEEAKPVTAVLLVDAGQEEVAAISPRQVRRSVATQRYAQKTLPATRPSNPNATPTNPSRDGPAGPGDMMLLNPSQVASAAGMKVGHRSSPATPSTTDATARLS